MHSDHLPSPRLVRALLMILLASASATSALASLSVSIPASVDEEDTILASVTGPGTLTILIDDVTAAGGTGTVTHALPTDHSSAGVLTYRFTTTDPGTQNETRTVTVRDVPLAITVTAPNQTDLTDPSPTFSVTTNWAPELCYAVIDGSDTRTLTPTGPTSFTSDLAIADGVHTIQYKCKAGSELPTVTRTIHIDTTPPAVTASGPNGVQTGQYATLTIDTDEISLCRYGTGDAEYGDLPIAMGTTHATRNQVTLLTQPGPQTYFVRCADVLGNAMAVSRVVSFTAQQQPTATVSVAGDEPLRAGTYKVTLRADQPLASVPTLTARFTATGAEQGIGLTALDGDAWEGYLTVRDGIEDASVSFEFSGTAIDGTAGTAVTDGALVEIDAIPPGPIESITIQNTTNGIVLSWFTLDAEEGVEYLIYRADHEGVEYTDEHARSADRSFSDPASGARYYWYRVAAMDRAGNVGPLSAEVYCSSIDPALAPSQLDALTLARIDDEILALQSLLTTADETISALETEANPFKSRIVSDMRLIDQAREARDDAASAIEELENAKIGSTKSEAESAITNARDVARETRTRLIRRIVPDQETETRQIIDERDIERNAPYAIATRGDADAHLDAATELQDHITITLRAATFSLWDWNNVEHPYTFVRKRVTLEQPVNDVIIVETIPKSVAEDVDEVTFSASPEVLERDPVVAWRFPVLQEEEYTYSIGRKASLDEVKKTRTIAYPAPAAAEPAPSGITGFALLDAGLPGTDMLLIALGALVIVALGAYYVALGTESAPRLPNRLARRAPATPLAYAPLRIVAATPRDAETLLIDAESAIDKKRYDAATTCYRDALAALQRDKDLALRLRDITGRVYAKLLLHQRLDEALAAIDRSDAQAARISLDEAQQLAARIGEQPTTLIKDATRAYREFRRRLNRLEIDHASHY